MAPSPRLETLAPRGWWRCRQWRVAGASRRTRRRPVTERVPGPCRKPPRASVKDEESGIGEARGGSLSVDRAEGDRVKGLTERSMFASLTALLYLVGDNILSLIFSGIENLFEQLFSVLGLPYLEF